MTVTRRSGTKPQIRDHGPQSAPSIERASREHDAAWVASALLVGVLVAGSVAGLLIDGLYRDPAAVVAMFRGYDLVALTIIAPLLAVTLLPALRRSARAELVRTGLLAYVTYHSALYVFGTEFNDIFLIHVAMFSLSVIALCLALGRMDVPEIAHRFALRTPVRFIGGILLFLAATLAVFWSAPSLRFAVTGELPEEGSQLIVPIDMTHLGWVLDLSLLVPAYALAGILLWRRASWGYVLATVVLIAGVLQQVDYMVALVFQATANIPGASGYDPIEPFITAIYLVGATVMLTRVRGPAVETSGIVGRR
jgi:hypothetical protein